VRSENFSLAESAHAKHQFQVGDTVSGEAPPVANPRLETVEFYKVSNLKDTVREVAEETPPPPWHGVPPPLSVYRERGHRRLAARTYEEKCTTCTWGFQMAAEMIIDHWNPSKRHYRTETFCYGPCSCPLYRSGPARKVPGRHGMSTQRKTGWMTRQLHAAVPTSETPGCRLQRQDIQMRDLCNPLNSCGAQGSHAKKVSGKRPEVLHTLCSTMKRPPLES
jgi:hypothetical protein